MMSAPVTAGVIETSSPEKRRDAGQSDRLLEKTASEEIMGSLEKALEGVNIANGDYHVNSSYPIGSSDHGSSVSSSAGVNGGSEKVNSVDIGGSSASSPWGSSFPSGSGLAGFSESSSLQGMSKTASTESNNGQQGSSLLTSTTAPISIPGEERQLDNNERTGLFAMSDNLSQEPISPKRKQSLELFLSQSPSKTLGGDFLKLARDPSKTVDGSAMSRSGSFLSLDEANRAPGPVRRKGGSPSVSASGSVTGTTASSRSASPFPPGPASNEGSDTRRTIQAYQVGTSDLSGAAASRPFVPLQHTIDNSQGVQTSRLDMNGNHLQQQNGYQAGNAYDQPTMHTTTLPLDQQYQQQNVNAAPQVLYMAVPTPDGRGQMLQPVQITQLPGQAGPTFVLPTTNGTMPLTASIPTSPQQSVGLATLPNQALQTSSLDTPTLDNRNRGSSNWNQYSQTGYDSGQYVEDSYSAQNGAFRSSHVVTAPGDPLASIYSAPQRPALDELLGNVRRLSRDQVGCRLLQQALDEEGAEAASLILNEGLSFWGEAMVDPFGNYLFQKILEKITPEERIMLVKSVSARLVNASLNLHGTRSVQKVVELCAADESLDLPNATDGNSADILTRSLEPAAARLCIDSHGNHVIQRILLKLSHKHSMFVFDAVAASVGDVARHRHGCCVIQRCLDSPPSEARSNLVSRIVEKSLQLMQDAYGNYVVQYVLDVCSDNDVHAVCESVVGKVSLLAIQKFSSNVMEKCLERATDPVRDLYLQELSDPERIRELMMDPFGNYVVQRALSVASHSQAVRLVEAMRPHLLASQPNHPNGQRNGGMRNTAGGRRIMSKICRRFPNFTLSPDVPPEQLYAQHKGHRAHHQDPPSAYHHLSMPAAHHQPLQYIPDAHRGGGGRRAHANSAPPQQQQPVYYDTGAPPGYYDPTLQTGLHPGYGGQY